ncbi:hypothetical protein C8Q72DRAFT_558173 [Fomitopsis betulina]|nr:hypothetical protein C8Q72DRAFT_558173 [Fomitopsis betulina]
MFCPDRPDLLLLFLSFILSAITKDGHPGAKHFEDELTNEPQYTMAPQLTSHGIYLALPKLTICLSGARRSPKSSAILSVRVTRDVPVIVRRVPAPPWLWHGRDRDSPTASRQTFPRPGQFVRVGTDQDEFSSEPGAKIRMHSVQCLLPVRSGPRFHHQSWAALLSSVYSVSPARYANFRSATPGYKGH